jgi:outer membrane protein assembly factor BamB
MAYRSLPTNRRRPSLPIHRRSAVSAAFTLCLLAWTLLPAGLPEASAEWPAWGLWPSRNMVLEEDGGIPPVFEAGKLEEGTDRVDYDTSKNLLWAARLGTRTFGNPSVVGGRVFLGTNNGSPRDPNILDDRGVIMCLEAATGELLWQLAVPKLGTGDVNDRELQGISSSPTIDGDQVFVVTNRAEVLCLDVAGQADGNDGPFRDEGGFMAGPGERSAKVRPTHGDIIWRFDMKRELSVFPQAMSPASVLVLGDRLYVSTGNGVDRSHANTPAPHAPAIVVLDKKTGEILAAESSAISTRLLHSGWSSPAYGRVVGSDAVVFGAGDGFVYGFQHPRRRRRGKSGTLKELWRFDANPGHYRVKEDRAVAYDSPAGPSEIIATPVVEEGKVYVAVGREPSQDPGAGSLGCFAPGGKGDLSESARVWSFDEIERSVSTVAVAYGMVYAADVEGRVYALDAESGKLHWKHDTGARILGSPVVLGRRIYIGNEAGVLSVLLAGKRKVLLHTTTLPSAIYGSVVAYDGVLLVPSQTHLFAFATVEQGRPSKKRKRR